MFETYALALIIGAAILFYQAWREYGTSDTVDQLRSNNQPARKDLENVRMSALTTDPEYKRGRWTYIAGFLLLYLVLVNSPDIFRVFFPPNTEDSVAGGAEVVTKSYFSDEDDAAEPAAEDPTMPLLVAIAMVLGVASPAFKVVENLIRSVAYAISGVPRNIYRVISNLEQLDYDRHARDVDLPLRREFDTYMRAQAAQGDPVPDATGRHLLATLQIIDLLHGPIVGHQRNVFFSLFSGEAPLERIDGLRARYNQLRDEIAGLSSQQNSVEKIDAILMEAVDLAGSMQCLFALFAIRSKRSAEVTRTSTQAAIIQEITATEDAQSINDIMIASCFGVIFGGVLVFMLANYLVAGENDVRVAGTLDSVRLLMVPLLPSIVLFATFTIFLRHVRIDQGNWHEAKLNEINFASYASVAIWPAVFSVAVFAIIMTLFSELVWNHLWAGEFDQARTVGFQFLASKASELPRLLATFFFLGCGLLFVADQHNNLPWQITVGAVGTVLSVVLVVVVLLFDFLVQPDNPNGAFSSLVMSLMMLVPIVVTIFFYASAAEFTETDQGKALFQRLALKSKEQDADGHGV